VVTAGRFARSSRIPYSGTRRPSLGSREDAASFRNPQGIVLAASALTQATALGSNGANINEKYHSGGFNVVYGDGHAKWNKWGQTFKLNGNLLEWSIWDRRIAP
jgi:prepilin-type processing-associated H-X9-DG protein